MAALVVSLGLQGCTGGGNAEETTRASIGKRSGSVGVVEIERSMAAREPEMSKRGAVLGAVFAKYDRVSGRRVQRLLGVDGAHRGEDGCRLVGSDRAPLPDPRAAVRLLDAGPIGVRVAGTEAELNARTFPELGRLVAGVFYAEDARLAPARADADEYRVEGAGSDEVGSFEVAVVSPPGPSGVSIEGAPVSGDAGIARTGEGVTLRWDAGDPRDRLDIRVASGGQLLECKTRDDGRFRLPADLLERLESDGDARLVLRRVRTQPFDVRGIEASWVEIATKRSLSLSLQ